MKNDPSRFCSQWEVWPSGIYLLNSFWLLFKSKFIPPYLLLYLLSVANKHIYLSCRFEFWRHFLLSIQKVNFLFGSCKYRKTCQQKLYLTNDTVLFYIKWESSIPSYILLYFTGPHLILTRILHSCYFVWSFSLK